MVQFTFHVLTFKLWDNGRERLDGKRGAMARGSAESVGFSNTGEKVTTE